MLSEIASTKRDTSTKFTLLPRLPTYSDWSIGVWRSHHMDPSMHLRHTLWYLQPTHSTQFRHLSHMGLSHISTEFQTHSAKPRLFKLVLSLAFDRYGDTVLSLVSFKPCQRRDLHSFRMRPLFSLCPQLLSYPPRQCMESWCVVITERDQILEIK